MLRNSGKNFWLKIRKTSKIFAAGKKLMRKKFFFLGVVANSIFSDSFCPTVEKQKKEPAEEKPSIMADVSTDGLQ